MGLRIEAIEMIKTALASLPKDASCLVMGALDCDFSLKDLSRRYPEHGKLLEGAVGTRPCDLKVVLRAFGCGDVKTLDINDRADIKTDLTSDIADSLKGQADLILDCGTLEHIFDAKAAIVNMNLMLKDGGIIIHMSPVSFYGHGFVNFNPSYFDSLYAGSGYDQLLRIMNVTVYNPFFVIDTSRLPGPAAFISKAVNKLMVKASLFRFNVKLPLRGQKKFSFFESAIAQFGMPKNLMYCCAYRKTADTLKMPYDVWE